MKTLNNIEKTQKYQEKIIELFQELAPQEIYVRWADSFDIETVDEKQVNIIYHGTEDIKLFKQECKELLFSCVDSVFGMGKIIKISKKNRYHALTPKTKKNIRAFKFFALGMVFVLLATAIIVLLCNYIGNRSFRETFYNTSSIKVDSRVRVLQLSDLHSSSYGKNNQKLLKRIDALQPDVIICTGDIVDSAQEDLDYALSLAQELSKIAPSYYIYGNNEVDSIYDFNLNEKELDEAFGFDQSNRDETALLKLEDTFEEQLEHAGIKVLKNEKDTIQVKTMNVDVYGVLTSNPSAFWSYSEKAFADYLNENPNHLKITAVHEPFIFEEFHPDFWGDLMIAGHTHGGVMRIPVLGPLYTHEGGLFPQRSGDYVYGRYDVSGNPLIVSSGLEHSNIFRVNNQPELVIIDINKF